MRRSEGVQGRGGGLPALFQSANSTEGALERSWSQGGARLGSLALGWTPPRPWRDRPSGLELAAALSFAGWAVFSPEPGKRLEGMSEKREVLLERLETISVNWEWPGKRFDTTSENAEVLEKPLETTYVNPGRPKKRLEALPNFRRR